MRLARTLACLTVVLLAATASAATRPVAWTPPANARAAAATTVTTPAGEDDSDLPAFMQGQIDKEQYLQLRNAYFDDRMDAPFEVAFQARLGAINAMRSQQRQQGPFVVFGSWTPIGPFPIPNGQTTTISTPVTGRTPAIAVDPRNPDVVYIGAAQGGVWRTLDGGATWTPIFDAAASLAVSALALAPSNPSILYVGTGESSGSCDSYFGVGLYRIDNADTAPVLNGPFNSGLTNQPGFVPFTGRAISAIAVNPTNADVVYCSTVSAIGGIGCDAPGTGPPALGLRGVVRTMNGTSASPSFDYLNYSGTTNVSALDLILDPNNASKLVVAGGIGAGIFVTSNALDPVPVWTNGVNGAWGTRCELAATSVAGVTTFLMGFGNSNGSLRRSADGITWTNVTAAAGFCGGQCFYDIAVAMPPGDASTILLGGSSGTALYRRSADGGTTFSSALSTGLHADVHAIAFAPSDPNRVYLGCDGGVYRSNDRGLTWTSVNTAGLNVTQFQSIAVHPIDPKFTIGGTQDNGTNWYRPNGTWIRADFGDGGFTAIDQNATDNTNVTMYHTYFNTTAGLMGYATVSSTASASDGLWAFRGCNGVAANGISCTATATLFYAPIALGPGSPNTIYYGNDRLYRSADGGLNHTVVSQAPIVSGIAISAIGIAPQNDNIRLIGLRNGKVYLTTTGSTTLTDVTGAIPAKYVARCTIDPTNANVAYVSLAGFGLAAGQHVWKTTNLLSGTPTWALAGNGIPDVPVNAFVIDPLNSSNVYAGTDIGVYASTDGGTNWSPFTTGMPVVAVFDMAIQGPSRTLRIATHGRGMWERLLDQPVATQLSLIGTEFVNGKPRLTWFSSDGAGERVTIYRRPVPGEFAEAAVAFVGGDGQVAYEDADAVAGRSYEYEVGVRNGGQELRLGRVWVDVPLGRGLAVRVAGATGTLKFALTLPTAELAKLELVDVTGRRVRELDLGSRQPGDLEVSLDASGVRPGVYWARLAQAGKIASTRVTVLQAQ